MYKFTGKKGQLYVIDKMKLNYNCPDSEKNGSGPGSCGGNKNKEQEHKPVKSYQVEELPNDFLNSKLQDDEVVALRYSTNIERDIKRGYSYGEWGAVPAESEEEAIEEWGNNANVVYSEELGGWLPSEPGLSVLSADWGENVKEALGYAIANARDVGSGSFDAADTPLYVLLGTANVFDSNDYPTVRNVKKYYKIEVPWKKTNNR